MRGHRRHRSGVRSRYERRIRPCGGGGSGWEERLVAAIHDCSLAHPSGGLVNLLALKVVLDSHESFAEPLEVDDFTRPEEPQDICHVGIV